MSKHTIEFTKPTDAQKQEAWGYIVHHIAEFADAHSIVLEFENKHVRALNTVVQILTIKKEIRL